jgi:arylsulfatase A-like enzyme
VAARLGVAGAAIALGACAGDGGERTVLSLAGELPRAEVRRPVDRIDIGSPSAEPHLVSGWSFAESYGGGDGTYAWSHGPVSRLRFREERAAPLRLRLAGFAMSAPGRPPQTVDVLVNGSAVSTVEIPAGGTEVAVDVPEAAVRSGDNLLELRYAYTAVPRDEIPGSTDWRPLAVGWDGIRFESPGRRSPSPPSVSRDGTALHLPPGTAVTVHERFPAGARLAVRSVRGDGRLVVRVTDAGESAREVVVRERRGASVELTGETSGVLALTLEAVGGSGPDGLVLEGAEVRAPAAASGAGASTVDAAEPAPPRARGLNVLLYLVDTLRDDALGCYGNPESLTPHADALARGGAQFRAATAHSPWTRPSTASILSGLQPQAHGLERGPDALPAEVETLAEMLSGAGYRCGAFVSNTLVAQGFGFDQGFERFVFRPYPEPGSDADAIGREAASWLAEDAGGRPFFAWVHPMDPHAPYAPPPAYRARFHPEPAPPGHGSVAQLEAYESGRAAPPPGVAERLHALYLGEVARTDCAFGRLRREIALRGLEASTIVVLVSDHGEEFQEHGGWKHSRTLYGEMGDVPLVIAAPRDAGGSPGALAERADQVDVVPTVLALAGIPARDLSGVAAMPPGRRPGDRPSLQSNRLEGCTGEAITWGEWKLIRLPEGGKRVRLFQLGRDPGERDDMSEERPVVTGYLTRLLDREQAALPRPQGRAEGQLDPETLERLRALGYAGP